MATVFIGLGSNLRDPIRQVQQGLTELSHLPATRLLRRSSLYMTPAIGPGHQPDYVNAVAGLKTSLPPLSLLRYIFQIERSHHRTRSKRRWRPRTLDLDILLYGQRKIDHPRLSVPHPLLHTRAFVLVPLNEFAPDLIIPGRGRVRSLLSRINHENIVAIEEPT